MKKKFLLVGMAAILGASLVFLGCDQGDSSEDETSSGPVVITSTKTVEAVTKAIEKAIEDGKDIVFDDLEITNDGGASVTINLGEAKVTIKGILTLAKEVNINASNAVVDFADENAKIKGDDTNTITGDASVFKRDRLVGDINIVPVETGGGPTPDQKAAAKALAEAFKTGNNAENVEFDEDNAIVILKSGTFTISATTAAIPDGVTLKVVGGATLNVGTDTLTVGDNDNKATFKHVTIAGSTNQTEATTIFDGSTGAVTIGGTIAKADNKTTAAVTTTGTGSISLANTTAANAANLEFALGQAGIKKLTLAKDATLAESAEVEVNTGVELTVDEAAKLTVGPQATFTVKGNGTVDVAGTLEVKGALEVEEATGKVDVKGSFITETTASGTNNGEIIIESGGKTYAKDTEQHYDGSGYTVVKKGGEAYQTQTDPMEIDDWPIIGTSETTPFTVAALGGRTFPPAIVITSEGRAARSRSTTLPMFWTERQR
jgi:hypothetical protein